MATANPQPHPRLRQFRMILWALVAVAAVGATALFVFAPPRGPGAGAAFSVVDQSGAPLDQSMLTGHPSLMFFGYTHCPDVCPTTMADLSLWFEDLGADADDLKAYFVSVDPERDTPEVLGDYVGWLNGRVTGVTGDPDEIEKLVKAWGVFHEKVGEGDDYLVNHTASVFLVNPDGSFEGTIAYGENRDVAVNKIRKLLAG
ncbi:SCO family protein [Devosia sp.]|uniref:SCO family protein n=1 Tax=Devosia sp. TaxID=1871048 RepID=UPI003A8F4F30